MQADMDPREYRRRQHAFERAQAKAREELDTHVLTGTIEPTVDWDADVARFYGTAPPTIQAPEV